MIDIFLFMELNLESSSRDKAIVQNQPLILVLLSSLTGYKAFQSSLIVCFQNHEEMTPVLDNNYRLENEPTLAEHATDVLINKDCDINNSLDAGESTGTIP